MCSWQKILRSRSELHKDEASSGVSFFKFKRTHRVVKRGVLQSSSPVPTGP